MTINYDPTRIDQYVAFDEKLQVSTWIEGLDFDHLDPEFRADYFKWVKDGKPTVSDLQTRSDRFYSTSALAFPAAPWTVDGVIPNKGIAWMYGAPGSFKSFVALDLAMSVATGRYWNGRKVKQGSVLYMAAEGADGLQVRRAAWEREYKDSAKILIAETPPIAFDTVSNGMGTDGLLRMPHDFRYRGSFEIAKHLEKMVEASMGDPSALPALVVIDTFGQTASGDTKEAVSGYYRSLREVQAHYGVSILVIDHTTKSRDSYIGTQAKLANADCMFSVTRLANSERVILSCRNGQGKVKDAAEFADMKMRTEPRSFQRQPLSEGTEPRSFNTLLALSGWGEETEQEVEEYTAVKAYDVVLDILNSGDPEPSRKQARAAFRDHPMNKGVGYQTVIKRFNKAFSQVVGDDDEN